MPATAYFIVGGSGAGFYLFLAVFELIQGAGSPVSQLAAQKIFCIGLVASGFFALAIESGRPLRGLYLFTNLRSSWISVEVLTGTLFLCSAALDLVFPSEIFHVPAICAAIALIISQGFIIYSARAIVSWNVGLIPLFFIASAFALGSGLLLLAGAFHLLVLQSGTLWAILIAVTADAVFWLMYLMRSSDPSFRGITDFLRRPFSLFLVLVVGRLLPVVLLAGLMVLSIELAKYRLAIQGIAGSAILAGAIWQKLGILFRTDFLRGIAMGRASFPIR